MTFHFWLQIPDKYVFTVTSLLFKVSQMSGLFVCFFQITLVEETPA